MNRKQIILIITDFMMLVLMPLLVAYALLGEAIHEWLGITLFLLFILHHVWNRKWYRVLHKGRYSAVRALQTTVNVFLILLMLCLVVSGMLMSRYAVPFIHIKGIASLARSLHMSVSYWGFVLTAFHLGLHGNMFLSLIKRAGKGGKGKKPWKAATLAAFCLYAVYGAYAFVKRQFMQYLFLKVQFAFFDYQEPVFWFLFDYISIICLFALAGYFISKLLVSAGRKKEIK